jgi:hypothetical protein
MKKKYCPIIKDQCIGDKCQLWIMDILKITNEKTGKSGIKDFSDCALRKIVEPKDFIDIKMKEDTERLINEGENNG